MLIIKKMIHFKIETSFTCKSYLKYLRIYTYDRQDIMNKLFREFDTLDDVGTEVENNLILKKHFRTVI